MLSSLSHSHHHLLTHFFPSSSSSHHHHYFPLRPKALRRRLLDLSDAPPSPPLDGGAIQDGGGGPIEIEVSPFSSTPVFAADGDDNPSPLQVATSVLLTGAISVFLFRSLRRRARRAKELRLRSSGLAKPKDLKEEALDSLKAMGVAPVDGPGAPPSPLQALLGGIAAGAIALILYKFTLTIEAGLNRQAISDNFSLAFSSFMESPTGNSMPSEEVGGQLNVADPTKSSKEGAESKISDMQESSDDS